MPRPRDSLPLTAHAGTISLRPFSSAAPRALLIGSSTGGPQALTALLATLTTAVERAPVLITQHMPPTFTAVLAEHLMRAAGRDAHEGEDGEPVVAGGIYVAPGGRHMRVVRGRDGVRIALGDDPPINFCKPAVAGDGYLVLGAAETVVGLTMPSSSPICSASAFMAQMRPAPRWLLLGRRS
jgi:chemotaxis response regulator CheB